MFRLYIALMVTSAACADVGTTVRIIDHVGTDGTFTTRDVELTTLRDLERVRGSIARMRGGATIHADPNLVAIDAGGSRAAYVDGASAVHASWIADGHVAVATDFDTLTMFTAYAHLETVTSHFAHLGVAIASESIPVFYNPSIDKTEEVSFPESDNAAFFPEADAFLLLPMRVLRDVPLGMNPGVIGHEYSHRVLYYSLWGGEMFTSVEEHREELGSLNAWNRVRATDEGVADFFGAAIAGDPDYLSASTPPELSEPRDLSVTRALDSEWVNGRQPEGNDGEYARYLPGSVVAAALWRISEIAGLETTERAVLAAQADLYDQVRNQFEYGFGDLEAAVIANLPAAHQVEACAALRPRYLAVWGAFAAACR